MRTGQYATLNADIVYEGELRVKDKLTGAIELDGERISDKVVGYFCHFRLLNGFAKTLYMSVSDMAKYAKQYSPSIKQSTSVADLEKLAQEQTVSKKVGWEGNFNDMALKTVVRRLISKYGYLSIEMQNAVVDEFAADSGRDAMIAEKANSRAMNFGDVQFEKVDAPEEQTAEPY
jgi:recombination protein RecT